VEKIVVGQRSAHVFGLASSKAANEVGVAEDAAHFPAIELVLNGRGIGLLASRGKLLLAVLALTAGDAEAVHDPITWLHVLDGFAYGFDHTAELVAQDIALLELKDDAVQEVDVAATNGRTRDLDDGIRVIDDFGLACLNYNPTSAMLS
jgi:hypothetical protein